MILCNNATGFPRLISNGNFREEMELLQGAAMEEAVGEGEDSLERHQAFSVITLESSTSVLG